VVAQTQGAGAMIRIVPSEGEEPKPRAFAPVVSEWMERTFAAPTRAQRLAWPVIAEGRNTLIFSPTGSGKTLAAFLWAINELVELSARGALPEKPYVVYVSPLRALANDIEKNLLAPLRQMREIGAERGAAFPDIRAAVRTGDTSAEDRQRMLRRPPHLLITTPESLYLLLASQFRDHLSGVRYVIVDEIHHLCGDKRGAHLMITLERLQEIVSLGDAFRQAGDAPRRELVRIGLSATQSPVEKIARFLAGFSDDGGERDCSIVDLGVHRDLDIRVIAPVPNLVEAKPEQIGEAVCEQLLDLIANHRTTLVFCNSRHLTERVAAKLNMLAEERQSDLRIGAHHGSMSRAFRLEMEDQLKSGALRAVVATSSLELGIDIGHLDLVCQVESPKSVAAGLQRVGRAGHLLGLTSKGRIFATTRDDLVECAVVAKCMLEGKLEPVRIPRNCLDVVAQHLAAMTAAEGYGPGDMLRVIRRAHSFHDLTEEDFARLLEQLSGRFGDQELFELRSWLRWDRASGRVSPSRGALSLVRQNVGTIPEYAEYAVHAEDYQKKLGTLDERFVQRLHPGRIFVLGTRTWEFRRIERNRVYVRDGRGRSPTIPSWSGPDYIPRSFQLGEQVARFRSEVFARLFEEPESLQDWLTRDYHVDQSGAQQIIEYFVEEAHSLDAWPSRETLVAETFRNPLGHWQVVVQSPYGASLNEAWAEALVQAARAEMQMDLQAAYNDDGFVLHLPRGAEAVGQGPNLPQGAESLLALVNSENLSGWVSSYIRESALFAIRFRHAAVRALAVLRMRGGQRRPVWQQEAEARRLEREAAGLAGFPLVSETARECREDHLDLPGLLHLLGEIESGRLRLVSAPVAVPSPFGHELLLAGRLGAMSDTSRRERRAELLSLHREVLKQILDEDSIRDLLGPEVIERFESRRQGTHEMTRARDADELLRIMRRCGELSEDEASDLFVGRRATDGWTEWLAALRRDGRAVPISFPGSADVGRRWIAGEDYPLYARALAVDSVGSLPHLPAATRMSQLEAQRQVILRVLRGLGPVAVDDLCRRYGLTLKRMASVLRIPLQTGEIQQGSFVHGRSVPQVCSRANLEELHRMALAALRREAEPVGLDRYVDFLLKWQRVHPEANLAGPEAVSAVVQQQAGYRAYPRIWERDILSLRIQGAGARDLARAVSSGEFAMGQFNLGEERPRPLLAGTTFLPTGKAPDLLELPSTARCSPAELAVLGHLRDHGADSLEGTASATGLSGESLEEALWQLFRFGLASDTSYASVSRWRWTSSPRWERARFGGGEEAVEGESADPESEAERSHPVSLRATGLRADQGRWYAVQRIADPAEEQAAVGRRCRARVMALMGRYGVASRELLLAKSDLPVRDIARGLRELFLRGQLLRGFFVRTLSGDQFALPAALERLRDEKVAGAEPAVMLSSLDPAAIHLSVVKVEGVQNRALASRYLVLHRGSVLAIVDVHPGESRFFRVRDIRLFQGTAPALTAPGGSEQVSALYREVAAAMLTYAVRWGQWEAIRISQIGEAAVGRGLPSPRGGGHRNGRHTDLIAGFTSAGFRLVHGRLEYRLRKRISEIPSERPAPARSAGEVGGERSSREPPAGPRASAAEGRADIMRRIVRPEEQRREDIHPTSKPVLEFYHYVISEYAPPPDKDMLVIFQCSVSRPYSKSPSHAAMRKAIRLATGKDPKAEFEDCRCHVVVLSSVIGPVPYELETAYPADERGGGVKHMSPREYEAAKPILAERMAAYLRRWHDRYRVITSFTEGRYGEVMEAARKLAGLQFAIYPDWRGRRIAGGRKYWDKYWVQVFDELLKGMNEKERGEAMDRLAAEGVYIEGRPRTRAQA